MSPSDYIKARGEATDRGDKDYVVTIDEKPYFPLLMVDVTDNDSVKKAATMMVLRNDSDSSSSSSSSLDQYTVVEVQGGITNKLYRVSGFEKDQDHVGFDSVLVRVFGGEGLIDRDVENPTFAALSRAGIAPPYLGRFGNGRVEGWLYARPLQVREFAVPAFSASIAHQMGRLHQTFVVPPHLQKYHSEPTLWTQLTEWMDQALSATFRTERDQQMANDIQLPDIPTELSWLRTDIVPTNAKTAFCHNDVLAANVLLDETNNNLHLIDFEYGGVNYIGFDIANHWNEFAGGTDVASGIPNYEWLPTPEEQRSFVQNYLGSEATSDAVNALLKEVQAFLLVNHLYWGLWAVNQAATEGCEEFDYMTYGTHRIRQYHKNKQELLGP